MGIGISAQENSGVPGPPSHTAIARLPHWEMPHGASVHWSILNTATADPLVQQQHLTLQAHTDFLCGHPKKISFLSFSISSRSCRHPESRLKRRHWSRGSGRGRLLSPMALPNTVSLSAFTAFSEGHRGGLSPRDL